jgi:hypothetical protein
MLHQILKPLKKKGCLIKVEKNEANLTACESRSVAS